MTCPKCLGFMEFTEGRDGTKKVDQWRCVNCGTVVSDSVPNLPCFVCGFVKCECKGKNWKNYIPKGKEK